MNKEEKIEIIKELKKKAEDVKREIDYFNACQLSSKLILNGSYGAFATKYFILFNEYVAGTITAMGRELTKKMNFFNEEYWYEKWHLDTELHEKMNLRNVKQIPREYAVSIYADTDSCFKDSLIRTNIGEFTIENWYNNNLKNGSGGITLNGHESVITSDKVLNFNDKELYFANVKRIIRHKVSKPKWKLKTKTGQEIIVTNDHSMIVFREGIKMKIKPSEILMSDKILVVK
jgi:hypothetical protein